MKITSFGLSVPAATIGTVTSSLGVRDVAMASNTIPAAGQIMVATSSNTMEWQDARAFGSNTADVSSAGTMGASASNTRADHVHRGVHLVSAAGSNSLYGDVNLVAGAGMAITTAGQSITLASTATDAELAAHAAAADPHPGYETTAEGAARITAHEAAGNPHTGYATDGDLSTHVGAADPHTGYQRESEKGAASGYASLDSGILVPIAQLPTGTSGTTVALGNHGHAHSALTGIGADDHHARAHDHSAAGDGTALVPATFTIPGGGKFSSGSSFPVSPASGDRCYRADLALDYVYDGTRWITTPLDLVPMTTGAVHPVAMTATGNIGYWPWIAGVGLYLASLQWVSYVATTNDASNYWTITLYRNDGGAASASIIAPTTAADAVDAWVSHGSTIDTAYAATNDGLEIWATKVGSPGPLTVSALLALRLVG